MRIRRSIERLEQRAMLTCNAALDIPSVPHDDACLLDPAASIAATFEHAGDADVFAFDAASDEVVTFDVTTAVESKGLRLEVLSPTAEILQTEFGKFAQWEATDGGRYYFRISSAHQSGDYQIAVSSHMDEPDGFSVDASEIELGTVTQASIDVVGDQDVFAISLQADDRLVVKATPQLPAMQLNVELYRSSNGRPYLQGRGIGQLSREVRQAGLYWVRIEGDGIGDYSLSMQTVGDDYADVVTESTPLLQLNQPVGGEFEMPNDIDVFQFDAVAGQRYLVEAGGASVTVTPPNGQVVFNTSFLAETDGRYTVNLRSTVRRHYEVRLRQPIPDDFPDSIDAATVGLEPGATVRGAHQFAGDIDVIRLTGESGQAVQLTKNEGATMRLLDADGQEITRLSHSAYRWRIVDGTDYFLHIQSNTDEGYETQYELVDDDYLNILTADTPVIEPGASFSGKVEVAGDVDVFAIDLDAGQRIHVELFGVWTHVGMSLLGPDGQRLESLRAPVAGRYYIAMSGTRELTYKATVQLTWVDDHDDQPTDSTQLFSIGDTLRPVSNLGPGAEFSGVETDTFAFDAVAGQLVEFEAVFGDAGNASARLSFSPSDGYLYKTSPNRAIWKAIQPGRYYINTTAFAHLGEYELRSTVVGHDDHGDTPVEASPIETGSSIEAQIDAAVDEYDVFLVKPASRFFQPSIEHEFPWLLRYDVVDAEGTVIQPADFGDDDIWQATPDQPQYIRVITSSRVDIPLSYTLSVAGIDVPADEPNKVRSVSAISPLDTNIEGRIGHRQDVDVFGFEATPNQLLDLVTTPRRSELQYSVRDEHDMPVPMMGFWELAVGSFLVPPSGKFYVTVTNRDVSNYTFRVSPTPVAGSLSAGQTELPMPQFRALYTVSAKAGQFLQIDVQDEPKLPPPGIVSRWHSPGQQIDFTKPGYRASSDGTVYVTFVNPRSGNPIPAGGKIQVALDVIDDDGGSSPIDAPLAPWDQDIEEAIYDSQDVDYFRIDLEEGYVVQVVVSPKGDGPVPEFSLVDENDRRLIGPNEDGVLTSVTTVSQSRFLRVSGEPTEYEVRITRTPEDHAGRIENASLIPSDGVFRGQLSTRWDVDIVLVEARAGDTFSIASVGTESWPDVAVFGPDGKERPRIFTNNIMYWKAEQDGKHAIRAWWRVGGFHLQLTALDDAPDNREAAKAVPAGSTSVQGMLESANDVDYFAIPLLAGEKVQFTVDPPQHARPLRVEAPDGRLLAADATSLMLQAQEDGLHYFSVEAPSQLRRVESYQIEYQKLEDDHPDLVQLATTLVVPGQSQTGVTEASGDVDMFRFQAEANMIYRFSGANVAVYSATGSPRYVRSYEEFLDWTPRHGGEYVLSVSHETQGSYTLNVDAMADDIVDYLDASTPAVRPDQSTGTFEVETDTDAWTVDLVVGEIFRVYASVGETERLPIQVVQPNNTPLDRRPDGWYEARRSGPHVVFVGARGIAGDYTVAIEGPSDAAIDQIAVRPHDSSPEIEIGTSIEGRFEYTGDADVYALDVVAGERIQIRSPQVSTQRGMRLELLNASGSKLAYVDGAAQVGDTIYWASPTDQRLYVRAWQRDANIRQYRLEFERDQRRLIQVDGREVVPLDVTEETRGFLLQLDVVAVGKYEIQLNGVNRVQYKLYSEDMKPLADLPGNHIWHPEQLGTYYIGVTFAHAPQSASVHFDFTQIDLWPSERTAAVEVGQDITGAYQHEGYEEIFGFDAQQGDVLFTPASRSLKVRMTLPSVLPSVPHVRHDDGYYWQIPRDGRYFLHLRGGDEYATRIERIGNLNWQLPAADDGTLTPIDFRQPTQYQGQQPGLFPFSAVAGERFHFWAEDEGNQLTVLDRSGAEVTATRNRLEWVAAEAGEYYLATKQVYPRRPDHRIYAASSLRSPTDIDGDGLFTTADLDALLSNIHKQYFDPDSDINGDGRVDRADADAYFSDFEILPGDANLDQTVDFADFLALSSNFGRQSGSNWETGDYTGDGETSFADFLLLSARFGQSI